MSLHLSWQKGEWTVMWSCYHGLMIKAQLSSEMTHIQRALRKILLHLPHTNLCIFPSVIRETDAVRLNLTARFHQLSFNYVSIKVLFSFILLYSSFCITSTSSVNAKVYVTLFPIFPWILFYWKIGIKGVKFTVFCQDRVHYFCCFATVSFQYLRIKWLSRNDITMLSQ